MERESKKTITLSHDHATKKESPITWHIPSEKAYDRLEEYLSNLPCGVVSDAARHEVEHLKALLHLDP